MRRMTDLPSSLSNALEAGERAVAVDTAVIAKLTADVKKALELPETRQRADAAGIELRYLPPEALGDMVRTETAYWAKTIKAAGIKAD